MTTKPTFPQMEHFFRLVEEKKITGANLQGFLEKPNKFLAGLAFRVEVDYKLTLPELIELGHYDFIHGQKQFTPENFPIIGSGKKVFELRLVNAGSVTTGEALEYLDSMDLRPAKIEHLLAFGWQYPDRQREFPIVALDSEVPDREHPVPGLILKPTLDCMREGSETRYLSSGGHHPDVKWGETRFLAFSK